MAVSSIEAARFLCKSSGWTLSNLKLQKMLYLAQMSYIGKNGGKLLIDDTFEAWDYGPVLPDVYRKVKMFGSAPIKDVFYDVGDIKDTHEGRFLQSAWEGLRGMSAPKLVAITHWREGAWASVYEPGKRYLEIDNELIAKEYKQRKASAEAV